MTSNVIHLQTRRGVEELDDVVLSGTEAHAIAALLRTLRQYADRRSAVDHAIQLLTSPTGRTA